mmetsp:Transcript_107578/g.335427  ORF Transcript_107578/g.335427 Transcript_107578/m.335427 type:complete len:709 (-) Transcript_107578:204-2330(-)
MAPKRRSATPGPKASPPAAAPLPQSVQAAPPSRSKCDAAREPPPPPEAPAAARGHLRRDKVAPRRPTDCGCLLILVVFFGYLTALRLKSNEIGDLERLTNGFDFRGRLCDDHVSGDFLHWCSRHGRVQWESPVCVQRCPLGGESIMCPVLSQEDAETEENLSNGSVVLMKVTRHLLTPLQAGATHRRWRFCVPKGLGPAGLASLVAGSSWQQYFFQQAGHVAALFDAPWLVASLAACAVLIGLVWVVLLSRFAEALLRTQFLFGGVSLTTVGMLLLIRAIAATSRSGGRLATLLSTASPQLQGAAQDIDQLISTGLEAKPLRGLLHAHLGFVGPTSQACIGLALTSLGVGVLIWFSFAKRMISVAADCSREAYKVAFRSPSLVLLPLLEVLLYVVILLETMYSLALLLSSADVKPRDLEIFSQRIVGIHRSIHWNFELVLQALCWIFAFLWLSEMVTALRSFILSKAAVTWYFDPTSGRRCCRLPILEGTLTAITYHLGSLALGAFVMAGLRAFHWMFMVLHRVLGERKESSRCLRGCLACFEFLITVARGLARHLSASAYTDLAITSSPLISASCDAAKILADGAGLTAIRSIFLRPVITTGNLAFAAAFSFGVWTLLDELRDGRGLASELPKVLVAEAAELGSTTPLAVLAGVVAFSVVRAFTSLVEDIADAVLYCYLWDRSDGVVDAEAVPPSFKILVGKMADTR